MVRVVKSLNTKNAGWFVNKSLSHLPRVIIETSFVYFLHHLGSQNGGEFVGHPGRQLSSYQAEKEKS